MVRAGLVPKLALNVGLARKDLRNFLKPTTKSPKGVFQRRPFLYQH